MAQLKEEKRKEYKAEYLKEYIEPIFEPIKVAGINEIQINSEISIET